MKRNSFYKALAAFISCSMIMSGCSATQSVLDDNSAGSNGDASSIEDGSSNAHGDESSEADYIRPTVERNESAITTSAGSGVYNEGFELELTSDSTGKIYYTTDGSDPALSDTAVEYTAPIAIGSRDGDANVVSAVDPNLFCGNFNILTGVYDYSCTIKAPTDSAVDKCTTIRAVSKNDDGTYSPTATNTYYIGTAEEHIEGLAESCEAAGQDLAVISISMDYDALFDEETGIYVKGSRFIEAAKQAVIDGSSLDNESARRIEANYNQRGKNWERDCHINFFEFGSDEATEVISQDCGIRVQGNYSRSDLQKGFRLYARKDYGDNNFNYAVFGDSSTDSNGETLDKYKTLTLRAGGNCAFTSKFNDTYWQSLVTEADCDTQASRPCVVYLNGEYWGLYVLQEDYSNDYYEDHYGVDKTGVVIYKGDAETYESGYKLDEGDLPDGETDEGYYFNELNSFFSSHSSLASDEDYAEFIKLVDEQSVMDYFSTQIWINNKWDWPGKNWSMWKCTVTDSSNEYADGRWRFSFYDMDFGGVSGQQDCATITIKDDNYKENGLLDMDTNNPAVLCFAYLMTNEGFRNDFCDKLTSLSETTFEKQAALDKLQDFEDTYSPLYDQFFTRYEGAGTTDEAINGGYASIQCIKDFLNGRESHIETMVNWVNSKF